MTDHSADPIARFTAWLDAAHGSDAQEPTAMTLATADAAGRPSARMVLLKGFDEDGFVFYTNYDSRKAREIEANPWAALVFWWESEGRQVRVEGRVEKVSAGVADAYFASRPRGSRLAAWASPQSAEIQGRDWLEAEYRRFEAEFEGAEVPRPPQWGGYRVLPETIEFWRNRDDRLHDRWVYERSVEGSWKLRRLGP